MRLHIFRSKTAILLLLLAYFILRCNYLDTVPRWDAASYWGALMSAVGATLNMTSWTQLPKIILDTYNAFGHPSMGYYGLLVLGQLHNFPNLFMLNMTNILLAMLSIYSVYKIFRWFLPDDRYLPEVLMATAAYALEPLFFGCSIYLNTDFPVLVFFTVSLACLLYGNFGWFSLASLFMIFSKEPGIMFWATILGGVFTYSAWIFLQHWRAGIRPSLQELLPPFHTSNVSKHAKKWPVVYPLVCMLLPGIAFKLFSIAQRGAMWVGGSGFKWDSNGMNCFGFNTRLMLNRAGEIFILDFHWVPSLITLILFIIGVGRIIEKRRILALDAAVPYGDDAIYIRGEFDAGWEASNENKMTYEGKGIYSAYIEIQETSPYASFDFLIGGKADDFSDYKFGLGLITLDTPTTLEKNGKDISISLPVGNYIFRLDATHADAPILTVTKTNMHQATSLDTNRLWGMLPILSTFLVFVAFNLTYITYIIPRYVVPAGFFLLTFTLIALHFAIRSPRVRLYVLAFIFALFTAQTFRTIDPLSKLAFGTAPFNKHSILQIDSAGEAVGNGFVYNAEFTAVDKLFNLMQKAIPLKADTKIIAWNRDAWYPWFYMGGVFVDPVTLNRTIDWRNTFHYNVIDFPELQTITPPTEAIYVYMPWLSLFSNEAAELAQLSALYNISEPTEVGYQGYSIRFYRLKRRTE